MKTFQLRSIKKSDVIVLALSLLAIARSISYFISGNDSFFQFARYLNVSPYPVAFTHPSFFTKKEINLIYPSKTVALDFMQNDEFFKNRANYRTVMFMFDAPVADRHRSIQYLYCENPRLLGIVPAAGEPLISVEFVYHFAESPRRVKYTCKQ